MIGIFDDYEGFVKDLACTQVFRRQYPDTALHIDTGSLLAAEPDLLARITTLILIRERSAITAEVLQHMPSLRQIVQTGGYSRTRFCHIDVPACENRGIAITETGVTDGVSAAETTFSLILAARRALVPYAASMQAGTWQPGRAPGPIGRAVSGSTLGILGYGRIGKMLARYAAAFDMDVQVWGGEGSRQRAAADGIVVPSSREAFFADSDIVSLHLRLTPQTLYFVTLADLMAMREDALLVNSSRSQLIEEGALETAFSAGRPGYLALDVYGEEPCSPAAWMDPARCLLTPHIGFVEKRSYEILLSAAYAAVQQKH